MQVYFNEFGKGMLGFIGAEFTPGKKYKVEGTSPSGLYRIMDDAGSPWTIRLDKESRVTHSMWYVVPCTDSHPDVGQVADPQVFSAELVLRSDNTCGAVMETTGVLSDCATEGYDGLYVEAFEYVDLLRKFEKLLSENKDLHGENAAMSTTIDNVNKVIGPNQPGEETLSQKVKRHTVKTEKTEESSSCPPFTEKNRYATNGLNISICYRGL